MRLFAAGQIILPLMLVLAGTLLMMDRMDVIRVDSLAQLWPVTLIAAGLEELYRWATGDRKERDR